MIFHSVCECEIIIPVSGYVPVFHEGVVKVPVKGLFYFVNIIYFCDTSNTDLFPSVCIRLRFSHVESNTERIRKGKKPALLLQNPAQTEVDSPNSKVTLDGLCWELSHGGNESACACLGLMRL